MDGLLYISYGDRRDGAMALTVVASQMCLLTVEASSRGLLSLRSLRLLVLILHGSVEVGWLLAGGALSMGITVVTHHTKLTLRWAGHHPPGK